MQMRSTDTPRVFSGKGVQSHAWLINVRHPSWEGATESGFRMPDIYNHERGQTYFLHPGVAFQRNFALAEAKGQRPVYNLTEFPPIYRVLTKLSMFLGMKNCWEGCARRTNDLVFMTGDVRRTLVCLSLLVLVVLCYTVFCIRRVRT
jgi:hypothetical protein